MSNTTDSRYEVGSDRTGAWYFTSTLVDAKKEAAMLSARLGDTATVFDRMAKRGAPQLWKVTPTDSWIVLRRKH